MWIARLAGPTRHAAGRLRPREQRSPTRCSTQVARELGLTSCTDGAGFKPTIVDIVENPKNLRFVKIGAAQAQRALDDVDAAVVNTNYTTPTGLNPNRDAILRENPKGPYVNLIAVRAADREATWVRTPVESYRTPEVKEFILTTWEGAVLPAW